MKDVLSAVGLVSLSLFFWALGIWCAASLVSDKCADATPFELSKRTFVCSEVKP